MNMTKNSFKKATLFFSLGLFSLGLNAQKISVPAPSPLQTVTQKFGLGEISIEYSRPNAKGRNIWGDVIPFGKVWRTGANSTTKITFTDEVKLEGKTVKPGTYGIYTIPYKDSCFVMLYSDLTLGGNVADYDVSKEVLRVKTTPINVNINLESFTIDFEDVQPTSTKLLMVWQKRGIVLNITTDIDARVMKSIEESMKSKEPEYFRAATYYFDNNKDLKQALVWSNKAVETNPKAFYMMLLKAKIEYALGDKKAGKSSAEKTIKLAEEAKSDDYIRMAKELIEKFK